jgi:hypothetical protein
MLDFGAYSMTQAELDDFLGGRPRYCAFASLRKDGSPFVIPVGYLYEDGFLYVTFAPDRAAVRRIRRDPRVSVTVFNDRYPVQFVVIAGVARTWTTTISSWPCASTAGSCSWPRIAWTSRSSNFLLGRLVFRAPRPRPPALPP